MNQRILRIGALVALTWVGVGCGSSTDETTSPEDSGADTTTDTGADTTIAMDDTADTSPIDSAGADTMMDSTIDSAKADAADAGDALPDAIDAADAADAADTSVDAADAADAADTSVDAADAADSAVDAADSAVDATEAGPVCTGDLSGIGTGDFRIAFRVTTTSAASNAALLNQRAACAFSVFWDIRTSLGKLVVETDGGSSGADYSTFVSTITVNDGAPHDVVLTRASGVLLLKIDGIAAGTTTSVSSFGSLPALATETDVCVGVDGTVALPGAVTNVCISH